MRTSSRNSPSNTWALISDNYYITATVFSVLVACSYYFYYFYICRVPLIGEPSFRIDFYVTTVGRAGDSLIQTLVRPRPISELYVYIQALIGTALFHGQTKYIIYPVQHLVIIFYFIATAYVVTKLYDTRMKVSVAFLAWLIFMTDPAILGNVYKLETIVGTVSKFFGAICLLCIIHWQKNRTKLSALAIVTSYCLSIFSKEDFIVPPLVLLGWYLSQGDAKANLRRHAGLALSLGASLAFFLFFNEKIVESRAFINPVQQAQSPYFMTLAPPSVFKVATFYAFKSSNHAAILTTLFLAALAACILTRRRWRETLVVCLAVGGMMGPYLIMPNHVFSYYALNWTAWESVAALLLFQLLTSRFWTVVFPAGALVIAPNFYQLSKHQSDTWYQAAYFRSTFERSANIRQTLLGNKDTLNQFGAIGVTGIGSGSVRQTPWQGNGETSFYLSTDLGLKPDWILFTTPSSDYQPDAPSRAKLGGRDVTIKNVSDYREGSYPLLKFDNRGRGTLLISASRRPPAFE